MPYLSLILRTLLLLCTLSATSWYAAASGTSTGAPAPVEPTAPKCTQCDKPLKKDVPQSLLAPVVQPPGQQVKLQRNPDEACTQCHKKESGQMRGAHATQINPNSHLAMTCTNCHGHADTLHRNGIADVMRFTPEQTFYTPAQQNSICLSCHQEKPLREAFWAHDVHALKIACSDCHQLHPPKDRMKGLDEKGKVKLCVDCHRQLQQKEGS